MSATAFVLDASVTAAWLLPTTPASTPDASTPVSAAMKSTRKPQPLAVGMRQPDCIGRE
jgi:hypothetical protein